MPRSLSVRSAAAIIIGIAVAAWLAGSSTPGPPSASPPHPEPAARADVARSPVQAELLSDVEIVQPGNVFRLGVGLTVQPGWHLVTQGQAEADGPTNVEFYLPDRFQAGSARWPAPVSFTRPDGTPARGYRDRVIMYREIRASNLDPDHEWHLTARATWLACKTTCEPGEATLDLWLGASISGTRLQNWKNIQLFDHWSSRLVVERP